MPGVIIAIARGRLGEELNVFIIRLICARGIIIAGATISVRERR